MSSIKPVPTVLKPCQTYLKLAIDHEKLNPTLSYWCRLYALQVGLKIDSKSKECREFLTSVMDWLEEEKKGKENDEKYTNEIVAQAHIENYGMKIFLKADEDDRAGNATKNTAKQFFTAAQIFEICAVFGELNDELSQKKLYAKYRAAYIIKCIKSNEKPLPPEDEKTSNEETSNQDIDKPQLPFNEFNNDLNQINNLKIDNSRPSTTINKPDLNYATTINNPDLNYTTEITTQPEHKFSAINGVQITQEHILKAQKYSKWATSALDYEDINTAVSNLKKALSILTIGREE